MTPEQKAKFILQLHKLSLQHFDAGGTVTDSSGIPIGNTVSIGPAATPYTGPTVPKMLGPGLTGTPNASSSGTTLTGPSAGGAIGNAVNPANLGPTGAINGALGTNNTFQAAAAPLQAGTTAGQLNTAYGGVQGALGNQAAVEGALTPGATAAAQEQAGLAGAYENLANGKGPNPALAQLGQTTSQNIANTTAEMAGQRGASSNPGLIAREAAQQGAATQQEAAQGAATLEAEQQIAGLQGLGTVAGQQAGEATAATTAGTQGQVGEQSVLQQANTNLNTANVAQQGNINDVNAGVAAGNQAQNASLLGSLETAGSAALPYVGAAASSIFGPGESGYGSDSFTDQYGNPAATSGANFSGPPVPENGLPQAKGGLITPAKISHAQHFHNYFKGGMAKKVPAMVSADEVYLSPDKVQKVLAGADPMKIGQKFGGKAKVKGDSRKNDTIRATLEEGGVVIPRHITTHKMSSEKAAAFVRHAMASKGLRMAS